MFKVATLSGVKTAQAYLPADDFTSDKKMDLALALGASLAPLTLPTVILSGALAPGDKYVTTPLRGLGRSLLEGAGGGLAGALAGGLLGAPIGKQGPLALGLGLLGSHAGLVHGTYASRRNVRAETGDYSAAGGRQDPRRQAIPVED